MSVFEKIGEKLHIGGQKKEDEAHKTGTHPPAAGTGHSTTPAPYGIPPSEHGAPHGAGTHGTEPHKEGEGEKKHEGFVEKIKRKKKERKERKEGEGSSSSSSDSD